MKTKFSAVFLFALGFLSAAAYLFFKNAVSLPVSIALKIIPTAAMCVWLIIKKIDRSNWPIFVGFLFSISCDVFMSLSGDLSLAGGIASNMLALVFYTVYYVKSDHSPDWIRIVPAAIPVAVLFFILYDYLGPFKLPVLAYCLIYIAFMWRSAARIGDPAISEVSQYVCFIGSLIITLSDSLLSLLLFKVLPQKDKYAAMVMILWWIGLYLLMITAELRRTRLRSV